MDKFKLSAQERKVLGRKVKTLRESGVLPANGYGKNTGFAELDSACQHSRGTGKDR